MSDEDTPVDSAEAETQPPATVPLEWEGRTFQIPATPGQMKARVMRAFERGKSTDVIEGIIGTDAFEKLLDEVDVTQLGDLMERVAKLWGFEGAGE